MNASKVPKLTGELAIWSLSTTMATVLGWVMLASLYFFYTITRIIASSPILQLLLSFIGGMVAGIIVGAGQWFVLRYEAEVSWANRWLWATVLGWGCAAIAWWSEYQILGGLNFEVSLQYVDAAITVTAVLGGVIISIVQWIRMRKRIVVPNVWIIYPIISWLIAGIVTGVMVKNVDLGFYSYLIALSVLGLIIGLGTGLAQLWLINYQTLEPRRKSSHGLQG
jgi:hypothetical protein